MSQLFSLSSKETNKKQVDQGFFVNRFELCYVINKHGYYVHDW